MPLTNPRLLKRGDIIRMRDGHEEVARNVVTVVQLSNGETVTLEDNDYIEVVEPTVPVTPAEIEASVSGDTD